MKLPVSWISCVPCIFSWVCFTSARRDSTSFMSINWISHPKPHSENFDGLYSPIVARDLKPFNQYQALSFGGGQGQVC